MSVITTPGKIRNQACERGPDVLFKELYAPDQGRSIAFIYDNRPCPGNISKYAVTVAEVERRTGLIFSNAIPKRQCNINDWE